LIPVFLIVDFTNRLDIQPSKKEKLIRKSRRCGN